jgi:RNA 2',3'-cyclic 3'-phosphodiesterase
MPRQGPNNSRNRPNGPGTDRVPGFHDTAGIIRAEVVYRVADWEEMPVSEQWRVFAAVDLTDEIKARITETARLLEEAGWLAKWVPEQKMHMTVRFYGDLAVPTVERLQEELRERMSRQPAFELHVNRVGAFPAPNRPRVVWLGIHDPFEQLPGLKGLVDKASSAAGLEPEPGPYKPHLTVGRLLPSFKIQGEEAVAAFQEFGSYEPIVWVPESVQLIRSKLGRGGSQYTVLEEFAFGPPDGTISEPESEKGELDAVAGSGESDDKPEDDPVEASARAGDDTRA